MASLNIDKQHNEIFKYIYDITGGNPGALSIILKIYDICDKNSNHDFSFLIAQLKKHNILNDQIWILYRTIKQELTYDVDDHVVVFHMMQYLYKLN